jgi:hypothetical protein
MLQRPGSVPYAAYPSTPHPDPCCCCSPVQHVHLLHLQLKAAASTPQHSTGAAQHRRSKTTSISKQRGHVTYLTCLLTTSTAVAAAQKQMRHLSRHDPQVAGITNCVHPASPPSLSTPYCASAAKQLRATHKVKPWSAGHCRIAACRLNSASAAASASPAPAMPRICPMTVILAHVGSCSAQHTAGKGVYMQCCRTVRCTISSHLCLIQTGVRWQNC